jgi:hypothetical protein
MPPILPSPALHHRDTDIGALQAADEAPVTVGIVNPRLGTFVECPLDRLAEDIAGVSANGLLQQIIFDVSGAEVSL